MRLLFCGTATVTPKYVRYLNKVYPKSSADDVVKYNMPKLTYYAVTNPNKLPKICRVLVARLENSIRRNRKNEAAATMKILDELIQSCHTDLSLFSVYVIRMVKILLEEDYVEHKVIAMNTFVIFLSFEDETLFLRQFTDLISSTVEICTHDILVLRHKGLQGLRSILRMKGSVENYVLQQIHEIVYAILKNHRKFQKNDESSEEVKLDAVNSENADANPEDGKGMSVEDMIPVLAHECLRELISSFSLNVRAVLTNVLEYCDEYDIWSDKNDTIPIEAILKLFSQQSPQCAYLSTVQTAMHLDRHENLETKIEITKLLEIMILSIKGSISGFVLKVVGILEDNILRFSNKDGALAEEYATWLMRTIGACSKKLKDAEQHVGLMNFVAQRLQSMDGRRNSLALSAVPEEEFSEAETLLIMRTLKAVSHTFSKKKMVLLSVNPNLIQTIFREARTLMTPDARLIALSVICDLLSTPEADYHYEDDNLSKMYMETFYETVSRSALLLNNAGEHFLALNCVLNGILTRFSAKGMEIGMVHLFSTQDAMIAEEGLTDQQRHGIQCMITSFLMQVAANHNCPELMDVASNWVIKTNSIKEKYLRSGGTIGLVGWTFIGFSTNKNEILQDLPSLMVVEDVKVENGHVDIEYSSLKKANAGALSGVKEKHTQVVELGDEDSVAENPVLGELMQIPLYVASEVIQFLCNSAEIAEELGHEFTGKVPDGSSGNLKSMHNIQKQDGILSRLKFKEGSAEGIGQMEGSMKRDMTSDSIATDDDIELIIEETIDDMANGGQAKVTREIVNNPSTPKTWKSEEENVNSVADLRNALEHEYVYPWTPRYNVKASDPSAGHASVHMVVTNTLQDILYPNREEKPEAVEIRGLDAVSDDIIEISSIKLLRQYTLSN